MTRRFRLALTILLGLPLAAVALAHALSPVSRPAPLESETGR